MIQLAVIVMGGAGALGVIVLSLRDSRAAIVAALTVAPTVDRQ